MIELVIDKERNVIGHQWVSDTQKKRKYKSPCLMKQTDFMNLKLPIVGDLE